MLLTLEQGPEARCPGRQIKFHYVRCASLFCLSARIGDEKQNNRARQCKWKIASVAEARPPRRAGLRAPCALPMERRNREGINDSKAQ